MTRSRRVTSAAIARSVDLRRLRPLTPIRHPAAPTCALVIRRVALPRSLAPCWSSRSASCCCLVHRGRHRAVRATTTTAPPVTLVADPVAGAVDVAPDQVVTITASQGTLGALTITSPAGTVAGVLSDDNTTWHSTATLIPLTTYHGGRHHGRRRRGHVRRQLVVHHGQAGQGLPGHPEPGRRQGGRRRHAGRSSSCRRRCPRPSTRPSCRG